MVFGSSSKEDVRMSNGSPVLNGKYALGRLIGRGNFSKVYLALDLRSDRNVAIKVVGKEKVVREGLTEQVKREITVMKMVKHPNVVELYEVMATKSNIYFVMELVRGGELFSKIAVNGRMREDVARSYFRQLISVLDFCHSRGVYHRDLKPENLLLDENGNLKIADFGFSAFADDNLHSDGLFHTRCGTPAYVAPEVILKKGYDGAKADLWSCGVILFVLLAGKLPFHDDNLVAMCKKIFKSDFRCPNWFSSDARRLVTKLLDPNPNTRITIAKIQKNPWFTRPIPIIPNFKPLTARIEETPCAEKWVEEKKPETKNAFHIISLSEGFDLSPLFEEKKRDWGEEEMRFVTRESAKGVISRLEDLAAKTGGGMSTVTNCENRVKLESVESGRRGKLAVVAEMFLVGKEVLVVEVKRDGGDPLEYVRFFSDHLRPALKDIIWASSGSHQETMTTGTSL